MRTNLWAAQSFYSGLCKYADVRGSKQWSVVNIKDYSFVGNFDSVDSDFPVTKAGSGWIPVDAVLTPHFATDEKIQNNYTLHSVQAQSLDHSFTIAQATSFQVPNPGQYVLDFHLRLSSQKGIKFSYDPAWRFIVRATDAVRLVGDVVTKVLTANDQEMIVYVRQTLRWVSKLAAKYELEINIYIDPSTSIIDYVQYGFVGAMYLTRLASYLDSAPSLEASSSSFDCLDDEAISIISFDDSYFDYSAVP